MSPPLPDLRQSKRILLVVQAGSLGDFILTLPALRILRHRFPEAYLEFMPQTFMLEISPDHWADRLSSPADRPGLELLFEKNASLPPETAEYFGDFDLIIWYGYDPDGVLSNNLRRTGCGGVILADWSPAADAGIHASDHVISALRPLGELSRDNEPEIKVSPSTGQEVRKLIGKYDSPRLCAVHPGSSSAAKNWPPQRFAAFIQKITARNGLQVLLIEGPMDNESVHEVRSRIAGLDVPILQVPLGLLAAALAQCVLFVGNDSGVAHLAAAVGTPTIALFGPTDPLHWAPRGKRVITLKNCQGLDAIAVEDVVEAANRLLRGSGSKICRFQEY
jgi:heptosyltransferase III